MLSRKKVTYGREMRQETHQAMILSTLDFVTFLFALEHFLLMFPLQQQQEQKSFF